MSRQGNVRGLTKQKAMPLRFPQICSQDRLIEIFDCIESRCTERKDILTDIVNNGASTAQAAADTTSSHER